MKTITKALAAGTLLAALGGGVLVAKADGFGPGMMGGGMMGMRGGQGAAAWGDPATRLGALKSELGIRPEQTASWDGYTKAVQDGVARMQALRSGINPDAMRAKSPADRDAFIATMRSEREQNLATMQKAAQALLPVLDEAQKAKAQQELPGLAQAGWGPHRVAGMGMGMGMGGGMGMMRGGAGPARP